MALSHRGLQLLVPGVGGADSAIELLAYDEFTSGSAPDAGSRAMTPGPGSWTSIDNPSDTAFIVNSGYLEWDDNFSEVGMSEASIARANGHTLMAKFIAGHDSPGAQAGWNIGDARAATISTGRRYVPAVDTTNYYILAAPSAAIGIEAIDSGFTFYLGAAMYSPGHIVFMDFGDGNGPFIVWINRAETATPMYPSLYPVSYTGDNNQCDWYKRSQFASGALATLTGMCTDILAGAQAPSGSDITFTHEADCLIQFKVDTLPSPGSYMSICLRVEGAEAFWLALIYDSGDLSLSEITAGPTITERGIANAVVSANDIVTIVADDERIWAFVNDTERIDYASAANYKNATDGFLPETLLGLVSWGGQISDLRVYPRWLSGDALTQWNLLKDAT